MGETPRQPRPDEVPAHKRNRFGQMQARFVSVDPQRLHILVRKPAGSNPSVKTTKSYDMISQMEIKEGGDGSHVSLSIVCRDVETDKPKRLVLLFSSAAEARRVHDLCERSLVTRETKPYKQYEEEYRQESVPIGSGHFAKVYLARHKTSGLPCASKVVDKTRLSSTETKNLLNEISIMRMLNHPHIVALWNVFEDESHLVLCEELCSGGELFDRIVQKKKYSELLAREVCKLMIQTMCYYHSRSVVHLDLKPENLLLVDADSDLNIKVTDWGLAQVIADGERLHRQCGTPGYTAPEVLAGDKANPAGYGTQADIWSMGVITYILLCGYPPYNLLPNATFAEEYRAVTAAPPVFEPEDWGPISREARDFVLRMIVIDPNRRWNAAKLLTHPWMTATNVRDDHLMRAAKCAPRRRAPPLGAAWLGTALSGPCLAPVPCRDCPLCATALRPGCDCGALLVRRGGSVQETEDADGRGRGEGGDKGVSVDLAARRGVGAGSGRHRPNRPPSMLAADRPRRARTAPPPTCAHLSSRIRALLPHRTTRKFKQYNAARKLRSAVRSIIVINRLKRQFSNQGAPENVRASGRDARHVHLR